MTLPPGPSAPRWQQMLHWIVDPVSYMESAARDYPDLFSLPPNFTFDSTVYVSHPEAMQQILTGDRDRFFAPGSTNRILQPFLGDYSVIMLEGDRHQRQRKLLMPPFHGNRLQEYARLIGEITVQVMERLDTGQQFVARSLMQDISLQVILQVVFGICQGDRYVQLQRRISELTDLFQSPLIAGFLYLPFLQKDWGAWSPWGRFLRLRSRIDDLLYAEIAERRERGEQNGTDILSLLMDARDEQGQGMTDEELRDELMTLLFAGHETTATAMAWSLYWTHYHSEVGDKVRKELATLENNADSMAIARLPYLNAVCNETLRIYPVGMLTFPRTVGEDPVEMMGYELPPGTVVLGCIYLTHQREDIYPQPKQFQPERFLERQYSPYEFVPFGGGSRRCIGMALASLEMKLVLGTILSNYRLSLAETQPVKPQRRGVTLGMKGGVKMVFEGRRGSTDREVTTDASQDLTPIR